MTESEKSFGDVIYSSKRKYIRVMACYTTCTPTSWQVLPHNEHKKNKLIKKTKTFKILIKDGNDTFKKKREQWSSRSNNVMRDENKGKIWKKGGEVISSFAPSLHPYLFPVIDLLSRTWLLFLLHLR